MGFFKKIEEEYNKKRNELSWLIMSKCIGLMVSFLEWKGLIQGGDWDRFFIQFKQQAKQAEDMEWLKKNLDNLNFKKP